MPEAASVSEQHPLEAFSQYEVPIWSNSATRDLVSLIPQQQVNEDTLIASCLNLLKSRRTGAFLPGALKGDVSEVALKIALDQIMAHDRRYARFDDEYIKGQGKLSRLHEIGYSHTCIMKGSQKKEVEKHGLIKKSMTVLSW